MVARRRNERLVDHLEVEEPAEATLVGRLGSDPDERHELPEELLAPPLAELGARVAPKQLDRRCAAVAERVCDPFHLRAGLRPLCVERLAVCRRDRDQTRRDRGARSSPIPSKSMSAPFQAVSTGRSASDESGSSRIARLRRVRSTPRGGGGPRRRPRRELRARLDDPGECRVVRRIRGARRDGERPREEVEHEQARASDRRQPPCPRLGVVTRRPGNPRQPHAAADEPRPARDRALHGARRALRAATDRARYEPAKDVVRGRRGAKTEVVVVERARLLGETLVAEPDGDGPTRGSPIADALLVVRDVLERLGEGDVARKVERRTDDRSERRGRGAARGALLG